MSKKDVKIAVEAFIEKYGTPSVQKVEWPQWEFEIKGISNVVINEDSLEDFGERWTFEGTAEIHKTDGITNIVTKSKYNIIGSAKVTFYPNGENHSDLIPEINQISITKMKEL